MAAPHVPPTDDPTFVELRRDILAIIGSAAVTPHRVVTAVFDIVRRRRAAGQPPYSESAVQAAVWFMAPER